MSDGIFLLLHSPLVGPYTWIPVAEELQRKGYRTVVPSLLEALDSGSGFGQAMTDCVERELENLRSLALITFAGGRPISSPTAKLKRPGLL